MAIAQGALVIGLTGPFGSGATTCATILAERLAFKSEKLSTAIRNEFTSRHPGQTPIRAQLQELGDELRKSNQPIPLLNGQSTH